MVEGTGSLARRTSVSPALACLQCFKSKCKCVQRLEGDDCERCHRLQKQCQPSDLFRKAANVQRKHNSITRVADLEGKVDSLVKLVCLVANSPTLTTALQRVTREGGTPAAIEPQIHSRESLLGEECLTTMASRQHSPANDVLSPSYTSTTNVTDISKGLSFNPDLSWPYDADVCLDLFRDKILPSFSFIDLPSNVTAEQLQRERPFLMRAIVATVSPCTQQKLAHGTELKRVLAQQMLVQNRSNLDLLQGLLTFTAWGYDHLFEPSGTLSRLILLATSLVFDLRLDKPLPSDEHMMKPMASDECGHGEYCSKDWFVAEEQRAVLACFVLSSIISIYFAQIDAMNWKPRMEESLRAIETNTECPGDVVFAFQVRLQLLAQKAVQVRAQRELSSAHVGAEPGPGLMANFSMQTLLEQLHQLVESLPAALQERGPLLMHMHYVKLCITELACMRLPHTTTEVAPGCGGGPKATTSHDNHHPQAHGNHHKTQLSPADIDFSWRSVGAIKGWMDTFFGLSPVECLGLSFIHVAQLARCLMVLFRLSTLAHPAWDCQLVRSTVDLLLTLEKVAEKLQQASREAGEQSHDDKFMRLAAMMRTFHAKSVARMGPGLVAATEGATGWLDAGGGAVGGVGVSADCVDGMGLPCQTPLLHGIIGGVGDGPFWETTFPDFGYGLLS